MTIAKINNAPLAYDESGDGGAVLLIHAGIADRRMWDALFPALAATHRVVRYDLRGYGSSAPVPPEPFAHRDDVVGLLDHLGLDSAVLVGNSLGGAVAIDTALTYPSRVAGLVLLDAAVSGHAWSPEFRAEYARFVGGATDLDSEADGEVRLWVVGPDRSPEDLDPARLAEATEMNRLALAAEAKLPTVLPLDPPAIGRLSEITAPTLVMAGARDLPDIRHLADRLGAEIPGAIRLPDVPDAAHLLPWERPEPVHAAIATFLTSLSR